MTRPANVTDEAWDRAVMQAKRDPHRARALLSRGVLLRNGDRNPMRLPDPPRNPTIRPNKKKARKRR